MSVRRAGLLAALAAFVILLDACKPLTIDDPAYYCYAAQIAQHPLDPYGFLFFGHQPAEQTLAPPLLPYWWALGLNLLGDEPFLWKLWLLPFALLFVFALHAICRRFAPGLELSLVGMTALSPAFLPGWNLMLDLPALALSLTALAVFFRAADRAALGGAAAAGLFAGLAMQTKYTAFVAPVVILLYAGFFRRVRLGLTAVALAVLVFAAWEGFMAYRYGDSHFLYHLHRQKGSPLLKLRLALPLLATLGGVASWSGLLGLAALGVRRRWLYAAAGLVALGFTLVAVLPESVQNVTDHTTLSGVLFVVWGGASVGTILVCGWRLLRRGPDATPRVEWFLLLWLGVEVMGYFALTPFPAVRRVLGVVVVGTLLAGRLLSVNWHLPGRSRLVYLPAVVSVVLGLGYFGVDLLEARAQRRGAAQAARWVRRRDPDATIWFLGTQGFAFHAERAHLRRYIGNETPAPGDWLVSDGSLPDPEHALAPDACAVERMSVADALPLRTHVCYYASGTPLEHLAGPRIVLTIYRKQ